MGTVEMDALEFLEPTRGRLGQCHDAAVREFERQVETFGQPGPDSFPDRNAIDDGLDGVRLCLRQFGGLIRDFDQLAVDSRANKAGSTDGLKNIDVLPLAVSHQWRQDLYLLAILQPHELGDHLFGRLATRSARRTRGNAASPPWRTAAAGSRKSR